MIESNKQIATFIEPDPWQNLKQFSRARIALGRTGVSIPLKETLQLKLAHAHAKDAVYSVLNNADIEKQLTNFQIPILQVCSCAGNRNEYLQRPDLGRRINKESVSVLQNHSSKFDISIIISDGLSAIGVNQHVVPVLQILIPMLIELDYSITPITLVSQARVAIGDEIGHMLGAKLSLIFIGERPGLSVFDSLGVYLTYHPITGLTDDKRNCISNIHSEGLDYHAAVHKIIFLIKESLRLQLSGVSLKDSSNLLEI